MHVQVGGGITGARAIVARAFVAQRLEHWSRKPGVESSILSEGKENAVTLCFCALRCDAMRCDATSPLEVPLGSRLASRGGDGATHNHLTVAASRLLHPLQYIMPATNASCQMLLDDASPLL